MAATRIEADRSSFTKLKTDLLFPNISERESSRKRLTSTRVSEPPSGNQRTINYSAGGCQLAHMSCVSLGSEGAVGHNATLRPRGTSKGTAAQRCAEISPLRCRPRLGRKFGHPHPCASQLRHLPRGLLRPSIMISLREFPGPNSPSSLGRMRPSGEGVWWRARLRE